MILAYNNSVMTKISIKTICWDTGLEVHQVRYRLKLLGIEGEKIHDRLYLYDYDVIDKVKNCTLPSVAKRHENEK